MTNTTVKVDLRMPEAAKKVLIELAAEDGRSLNSYINRVLAAHVRRVGEK